MKDKNSLLFFSSDDDDMFLLYLTKLREQHTKQEAWNIFVLYVVHLNYQYTRQCRIPELLQKSNRILFYILSYCTNKNITNYVFWSDKSKK